MKSIIIVTTCIVFFGLVIFCLKKNKKDSLKELKLTYKMSAGIPFKRVYEIEDDSIVAFVRSYIAKNENTGGKVGAPIYTTYVFKGLKEGTTTITFKVISISNDNDIMSEDKKTIRVDANNNIKEVTLQQE